MPLMGAFLSILHLPFSMLYVSDEVFFVGLRKLSANHREMKESCKVFATFATVFI